jgi:hypothetical protein
MSVERRGISRMNAPSGKKKEEKMIPLMFFDEDYGSQGLFFF